MPPRILTLEKVKRSMYDFPLFVDTYTFPSSRPTFSPRSVKNTQLCKNKNVKLHFQLTWWGQSKWSIITTKYLQTFTHNNIFWTTSWIPFFTNSRVCINSFRVADVIFLQLADNSISTSSTFYKIQYGKPPIWQWEYFILPFLPWARLLWYISDYRQLTRHHRRRVRWVDRGSGSSCPGGED